MNLLKRWFWRKVSREKRAKLLFIIVLVLLAYVIITFAMNPIRQAANMMSPETGSAESSQSVGEGEGGLNLTGGQQGIQEQESEGFISSLIRRFFPGKEKSDTIDIDISPAEEEQEEKEGTSVNGVLSITFVDVGQGDCTIITQNGESVMIDTGYWMQKEACESVLYENHRSELSALILTHPDADHIGNADSLVRDFYVNEILMPEKESDTTVYQINMQAFKETGTPIEYVKAGDKFYLGDAKIYFFGPVTIPEDPEDTNNASLMMKIEFGNTNFLIIGDAELEEEAEALEWARKNHLDLSCDVLKCGHHGSANSLYEPLYKAAKAEHYVISCGSDNEYGHPSQKVLDYIERTGGQYYLTQTRNGIEGRGDITVVSDGERLKWTFHKRESQGTESDASMREAA